MDKAQLAQALRQRQYTQGYLPRRMIDAVSDDDIIDSYITCSCCGEKQVTLQELETVIEQASDAYHFLTLCHGPPHRMRGLAGSFGSLQAGNMSRSSQGRLVG